MSANGKKEFVRHRTKMAPIYKSDTIKKKRIMCSELPKHTRMDTQNLIFSEMVGQPVLDNFKLTDPTFMRAILLCLYTTKTAANIKFNRYKTCLLTLLASRNFKYKLSTP